MEKLSALICMLSSDKTEQNVTKRLKTIPSVLRTLKLQKKIQKKKMLKFFMNLVSHFSQLKNIKSASKN